MTDVDEEGKARTRATRLGKPGVKVGRSLRLVVVEGHDLGAALDVVSQAPQLTIGTSSHSDLRLTDDTVSRRHIVLEREGHLTRIVDPGSTNGIYVDGVLIRDGFLQGGEVVRCGRTTLRAEIVEGVQEPPLPSAMRYGRVYGASPRMRRLYPLFDKLAQTDVSLVVEGETGTGKENLAESIHEASGRRGPFVVFDCTTVSAQLMEAELFGHERGAFTGAVSSNPGLFEAAQDGTLFIDEIGDLDLSLQPKLLRAIERREIRRVGGTRSVKVDLRVIAATRRNLDREVEEGRFRDDLFHRLAIARVELPPLRERQGDVTLLARHFAQDLGAVELLSRDVLQRLEAYPWPGNVRELRNAVARLLALGELHLRAPKDAPRLCSDGPDPTWVDEILAAELPFPEARQRCVEQFQQRYVARLLDKHGNVGRAAEAAGVAKRYFQLLKARSTKPQA